VSKIHFQLGIKQIVEVNLPSKKPGDGDIFVGKIKAQINSLRCSQTVSFHRHDLITFFDQVAVAEEKLKSGFKLESVNKMFSFIGSIDSKARFRIDVRFKDYVFEQPENIEWQAQAAFTIWPDNLKQILKQRDNLSD
jgi:hypothetical protein